jgi:hypothetical protein
MYHVFVAMSHLPGAGFAFGADHRRTSATRKLSSDRRLRRRKQRNLKTRQ